MGAALDLDYSEHRFRLLLFMEKRTSPTRVLLPQLLSRRLKPASITQKNLWNSIFLCIQASACLTFVSSIQNVPCVYRMEVQLYPETKWQLAPGKQPRSQLCTLAQSKVNVSSGILPRPAWHLGKGFQTSETRGKGKRLFLFLVVPDQITLPD